jgi:TonB-linked SusC/RagA family outer membrane protein
MKKKRPSQTWLLTAMRITCVQVFMALTFIGISYAYEGEAQEILEGKISLQIQNQKVSRVLKQIEKQADVKFVFSSALIGANRTISLHVQEQSLNDVLEHLLLPLNLNYEVSGRTIIVRRVKLGAEESLLETEAVAHSITGKVTDNSGQALPGVSILLKGTTTGTVTDPAGKYALSTPEGSGTLVFSFVGYTTEEIAIDNRTTIDVSLVEDIKALSEVVVVGYGSVQKRELTSAVTSISSKDFVAGAFSSPLQMIEGKVPGLVISSTAAGDPNAGISLQVRGASSIQAGNSPLIIIDGMPGGDIRNLAQQDIESISVLRDAAAAAIYGSRGANGVVLVQTKQAKSGKVSVAYDSFFDHDVVAAKPDILSAEEFLARKRDTDRGARTNWYDELIRKDNFGQNHLLSVSGGNENTLFRISGNYRKKTAIDIASERREYGLRSSFQQKALGNLLQFNGNISYRITGEEFINPDYGANNANNNYGAFQQAVKLNPTLPIMDPANPAKYNTLAGFDTYNPVQNLRARENGADNIFSVIDITTKLNLLKNLSTELKLAQQLRDRTSREYYTALSAESVQNNRTGRARLQEEKWRDYTLEWITNYNLALGRNDLQVMGGYSYQEFNNKGFWAENMGFPSDAFGYNNLDAGEWQNEKGRLGMDSWRSKEKVIAFLGRASYSFDDTYFLTASVRYEGNTKFGADNKWGAFPAASAAWRFSKLPLFTGSATINDLKLRASWGVTGRSGFSRYTSLAKYTGYGRYQNDEGVWMRVYGPGNNYNPNLRWEKAIAYDLGIDFALFNNKLSGSIDAFVRQNSDLISDYQVPVPPNLHGQKTVNVGTASSRGIDLSLNWNAIDAQNFSYTTGITASYAKAKLDSWSNDEYKANYRDLRDLPSPGNPGPAFRLRDGTEIGNFFGYKYAGVDENGNILIWKNGQEGTEKLNASSQADRDRDRTFIGNGMPKYQLAWTNRLRFKNIDLSLLFQGRFDYKIMNLYQMYYGLQAETGVNLLKDAYERNGQIKSGKVITDYFLESGDYFRLENITIGWSPKLPVKYLSNTRIYGSVRNVFTLTGYTGLDPAAVGVTGLEPGIGDLNVYPITRTFTLGAQISF